ncbi:hypothetical protein [Algoriphagus sp. CAU 1675]|uniref:PKD domain-containing protein n=1 Tax=Algoriphagus sp. CAU 1675 TaxID=3032597 RepID=UPI0023DC72C7|nr:hypothetical protein [Algoriphagus sp. CAU 1675]MDF2156722.1 hypothetical protein [Algoriphagus sp. CAU 1675]
MSKFKVMAFWLSVIFAVASCMEENNGPVNPLTADAGDAAEGFLGSSSLLDGSNSTNSTGQGMSYEWELLQKPSGAEVTISATDEAEVEFVASETGDYVFQLTVSFLNWEDTDRVTITINENPFPNLVAKAGEDRVTELTQSIALDGTNSVFENGQATTVLWEIISKPDASIASLQNSELLLAQFSPDKVGDYTLKLTLTSGSQKSEDLVKITIISGSSNEDPQILNADILEDRTLTNVFVSDANKLDYLVTKDIAVRSAKLTVEPGVRIGFEEGAELLIAENGFLKAYSADYENNPIVFQGKTPGKGFWDGIKILSQNQLEYLSGIEIRDAGKLGYGIKFAEGVSIFLSNSKIHNNEGIGVIMEIGSTISEFKNNQVFDNSTSPLQIPARIVSDLFSENQFQNGAIQVTEGKILNGLQNYWPTFDVEYDVLDDLVIYNGSTLSLSNGAHLNMANDKAIRVIASSALRILGEETAPVVIEGKTKEAGAWRGIYIENSNTQLSSIIWARINHAGSNPIAGQEAATIKLGNKAFLKMERTVIDHGDGHGMEAVATNLQLQMSGNIIRNQAGHPLSVSAAMVEYLDYMTVMDNNGFNEVAVDGFTALAKDGGEIVWKGFANQTPYVIKGLGKDLLIQSGMRIKEGVTIKMQPGSRIDVQNANGRLGYLTIEGQPNIPVTIKGTEESSGSWYGITYSTDNTQNYIQYAEILHAGKTMSNNFSAAITVDNVPQGSLLIQNSKIRFSGQHGIAVAKQFESSLRTGGLTFEGIPGSQIYIWE